MEWLTAIMIVTLAAIALTVRRKWISRNLPPSPTGLPFVGNFVQLLSLNYETVLSTSKKLGGLFCLQSGGQVFVFVNDWKSMKEAIITQTENFSNKYPLTFTKRVVGVPTFLLIDGIVWREKRRFTIHHLRNFGFGKSEMETVIKGELSKICDIIDNYCDSKKPFHVKDFFFKSALNVIWGIVAGTTYDYNDAELDNFTSVIKQFFADEFDTMPLNFQPYLNLLMPWYFPIKQFTASFVAMKRFIDHHVEDHRRTYQKGYPRDYIDSYLTEINKRRQDELKGAESCYQYEHLVGAVIDLFQGGIETNVTTMEWALLYMSLWPEIQQRVQKELDDVIGRNRPPNYADSKELPYTRATILEILRFSSIVPLCSPRLARTTTEVNGMTIPKGAIVIMNLYAVNNDPDYWGDPEVFRPSRFFNDQGQIEKPEFLVPFSTGLRVCPGESVARMEVFLVFTTLMQRYTFRLETGKPPPTLKPIISVARAPQPFSLIVEQRT